MGSRRAEAEKPSRTKAPAAVAADYQHPLGASGEQPACGHADGKGAARAGRADREGRGAEALPELACQPCRAAFQPPPRRAARCTSGRESPLVVASRTRSGTQPSRASRLSHASRPINSAASMTQAGRGGAAGRGRSRRGPLRGGDGAAGDAWHAPHPHARRRRSQGAAGRGSAFQAHGPRSDFRCAPRHGRHTPQTACPASPHVAAATQAGECVLRASLDTIVWRSGPQMPSAIPAPFRSSSPARSPSTAITWS
jgi:hypothetical protein